MTTPKGAYVNPIGNSPFILIFYIIKSFRTRYNHPKIVWILLEATHMNIFMELFQ